MKKSILNPRRVRRINGGFSFIPHRFLTEGFYGCLNNKEKSLYMFLVLASDNNGLSYYSVLELPFHPPGTKLISKLVQQIGKRI